MRSETMPLEILFPVEHDDEWNHFTHALYWLLQMDHDAKSRCDGTTGYARRLLEMRGYDADASLDYYKKSGGFCDCEILLNTDHSAVK